MAPTSPTNAAPAPLHSRPCGTVKTPPARYRHVVWVWMENHARGSVIGNPSADYSTALARECGTDSNYDSVGSPSLPNYLGATSGSTQRVTDDGDPGDHSFAVENPFRQVRAGGGTERSFAESILGLPLLGRAASAPSLRSVFGV